MSKGGWQEFTFPEPIEATPARSITWDDVRALYQKLADEVLPARKVRIIGRTSWDSMLAKSSEEERDALEALEKLGDIIISDDVPHGAMYEFTETHSERRLRGE